MGAANTNTPDSTGISKDTADFATNKVVDAAAGLADSIPFGSFFDLGKRLRSSEMVKKAQAGARDVIVKEGNDKSSWLGQIFEWIANLMQSIGTWLDKTFGSVDETPSTPPKAAGSTTPPPASDPKAAQAAAAAAKPNTPVQGGAHADAPGTPNAPANNKGQGAQK